MKTEQKTDLGFLDPADLAEQLQSGARLQLIDVRSPREYDEGHVPGALNVPLEQVESRLGDLNGHEKIVLLCQSGTRAEMCRALLEDHRTDMAILAGGTTAWVAAGLPTVATASSRLPLMRQVQIGAGSLVLIGSILGYFVNSSWIFLAMFVGTGLLIAGTTGFCGMANLLASMPWNRSRTHSTSGECCSEPLTRSQR